MLNYKLYLSIGTCFLLLIASCSPESESSSNNSTNNINNNTTEICFDGVDNNNDGLKDCEDTVTCGNHPYCENYNNATPEICDNDIDDNDDGYTDCEDLAACAAHPHCTGSNDAGTDTDADADGNPWDFDADVDDACPPEMQQSCDNPHPSGCIASEIANNGLDDDCNGIIDDTGSTGCNSPGEARSCFLGPPNRVGVGACVSGQQICTGSGEFFIWGPCENSISPSVEICDGLDNDCNGCDDDGLCCSPPITCPTSAHPSLQGIEPFVDFILDGADFYTGTAHHWEWEITNGPCDNVLGIRSFTMAGNDDLTYIHSTSSESTVLFNFQLSGQYTVKMRVYYNATEYYECIFVINVAGPGLRVEVCWDTAGDVDMDTHVLQWKSGQSEPTSTSFCADDGVKNACYYMNCKVSNWDMGDWGLSNLSGGDDNPRLDIDNIGTVGKPENINIDIPGNGDVYRIGIHHYGDEVSTNVVVNIYCDGVRLSSYGYPVAANGVNFDGNGTGGGGCDGDMWRVADVSTSYDATGNLICNVQSMAHPTTGAPDLRSGDSDW
jgi:hypothetical protein